MGWHCAACVFRSLAIEAEPYHEGVGFAARLPSTHQPLRSAPELRQTAWPDVGQSEKMRDRSTRSSGPSRVSVSPSSFVS